MTAETRENRFISGVRGILSEEGRRTHPRLHEVYADRAPAWNHEISRCPHEEVVREALTRYDGPIFQLYKNPGREILTEDIERGVISDVAGFCPDVRERFIMHGTIGKGCECQINHTMDASPES
jgi:hypothetical protein